MIGSFSNRTGVGRMQCGLDFQMVDDANDCLPRVKLFRSVLFISKRLFENTLR